MFEFSIKFINFLLGETDGFALSAKMSVLSNNDNKNRIKLTPYLSRHVPFRFAINACDRNWNGWSYIQVFSSDCDVCSPWLRPTCWRETAHANVLITKTLKTNFYSTVSWNSEYKMQNFARIQNKFGTVLLLLLWSVLLHKTLLSYSTRPHCLTP